MKAAFQVIMNDGGDDDGGLVFDEEIHVSACASMPQSCSFEYVIQSLMLESLTSIELYDLVLLYCGPQVMQKTY